MSPPEKFQLVTNRPMSHIVMRHQLKLHQYADECQVYISAPVDVADIQAPVKRFRVCLDDINTWLAASRLPLNPSKMEVLWLGSSQQLQCLDIAEIDILSSQVKISDTARDLGIIVDSQLAMSAHVSTVCQSGFKFNQL